MSASYDELAAAHELIVIEGAGSPAEVNLRDQVNNRMVEHADAAAVLVADIDRGGAFAHLYGTWSLVPESTRARLRGFVLNKFRGDAGLLTPGPERIADLTGMVMLGVLPMLDHRLPAEEGARAENGPADAPMVVLPRFPFGSNLDEFHALPTVAQVRWATGPGAFDSLDPHRDLVILPGSKHVVADLAWMHDRGLAGAVRRAADRGVRVLGVCGGAMMLGRTIADPGGVEGGTPSNVSALGLLDLSTRIGTSKTVGRAAVRFGALGEPFASLSGREADGYEIRFGEVSGGLPTAASAAGRPVAWRRGNVLATTVHGLLEDSAVVEAVVGRRPASVLEDAFDELADAVDEHLDATFLATLANR
jgi:adenosylcobyric acid synthase